jgi:hypothetical protein
MPYNQPQILMDRMVQDRAAKPKGGKRRAKTLADMRRELMLAEQQKQLEDEFNRRASMRVPEMPE